jgi:hypothetical protein
MQAKMMLVLLKIDRPKAQNIIDAWNTMVASTIAGHSNDFVTMKEYIDWRITDLGT